MIYAGRRGFFLAWAFALPPLGTIWLLRADPVILNK